MTRATDFLIRAAQLVRARGPAPVSAPVSAPDGCEVACAFVESGRSPRCTPPVACSPGTFRLSGPGGAVLHVPLQASAEVALQVRVTQDAFSSTGTAGEVTFVCVGDVDGATRVSLRLQAAGSAPTRRARWMSGHDPDRTTCIVLDQVPYALGRAERALVLERPADFDVLAPAWMYTSLRLSSSAELVATVRVDDADRLFEHLPAVDSLLDAVRVCRYSLSPAPVSRGRAAPRPVPGAWAGGPALA